MQRVDALEKTLMLGKIEGRRGRGGGGRDILGVWGGHVHTIVYKTDNQQGLTVYHRELCSTFCNNLNGKRI